MRDSLAFDVLTSLMTDDWRADSPLPSTSQEVDPIICLDNEVCLDPQGNHMDQCYEETLASLYSEDSQSDPLWNSTSMSVVSCSPPASSQDADLDFLSDDCFMDSSMSDVKGELKTKIKAKRLASGQEEINVELSQPKDEQKEVPEEDKELQEERKEKNRLAAQKCRNKKRERADTLEHDIDRLETRQDRLKDEIQKLQDEKEHLEGVIQIHGVVCPKIRKLDS